MTEKEPYTAASWRPNKKNVNHWVPYHRGPSRLKVKRGRFFYITKDCKSYDMGTKNKIMAIEIQRRWDEQEWKQINSESKIYAA